MIQWSNFLSDDDVVFVEGSNLVVIMLASVTNGESRNGIRLLLVEMEVSDEVPRRRRCCCRPPP